MENEEQPLNKEEKATTVINLFDPDCLVEGLKLNIGSGVDYKKGFINIDLYDQSADMKLDVLEPLPFHDNSIAQILAFQTVEHFPKDKVLPFLKECQRILKPNGNMIITVPDVLSICETFIKDPSNEWVLAHMYGNQSNNGQFHKWGYTANQLFLLFGFAGFRHIGISYFQGALSIKEIFLEARK